MGEDLWRHQSGEKFPKLHALASPLADKGWQAYRKKNDVHPSSPMGTHSTPKEEYGRGERRKKRGKVPVTRKTLFAKSQSRREQAEKRVKNTRLTRRATR